MRVSIADYDPTWPTTFAQEADRLRQILGARVLHLEHAGSTSVPGLPAKPIIDIVLVVPSSAEESAYLPDLIAAGYVLRRREPEWFEHRLFKGPDADINLHVFSQGCEEIERMLRFRDWLRTHPEDRERYLQTKLELSQQEWEVVQQYADAKTHVIGEILRRAAGTGSG